MSQAAWIAGSFMDNFNAAAMHLGYDSLPVAWGLAMVDWPSLEDRDAFLGALVKPQSIGVVR